MGRFAVTFTVATALVAGATISEGNARTAWTNGRSLDHSRDAAGGEASAITCETVRAYVSQMGLAAARAMARAGGMTTGQERRAKRCLARSD